MNPESQPAACASPPADHYSPDPLVLAVLSLYTAAGAALEGPEAPHAAHAEVAVERASLLADRP